METADKKKESYRLRRCTQRTLSHSHSCTTRAWCETHRGAMTLLMHMFLAAGGRIMARSQTPRRSEASRSPITQRTRRPRQRSKARARFYVLLALIWIHVARSLIVTDPREDTRSPHDPSPVPPPSSCWMSIMSHTASYSYCSGEGRCSDVSITPPEWPHHRGCDAPGQCANSWYEYNFCAFCLRFRLSRDDN